MIGVLLLLLFSFPFTVQAATTGKIAGKVLDKSNGQPLAGANVIVVGTTFGAAADLKGEYYILNLPPGNYTVEARMIGYGPVKIEKVLVRTNATTTLNFQLSMEVLTGETIVVSAEAISFKKDQTSSVRNVSSEQISLLPVESIDGVVSMQAGVVNGHFRGGRNNEVAYMIDGLQVTDFFNKATNNKMTTIENEVIQDIEIISGTFNAEYGRAMSGVVNAVTKDGGNRFTGSISGEMGNYYTSNKDVFIGLKDSDVFRKTNLRFNLAGPIIKDRLSFLINYRDRDEKNELNGIYRFNPWDYSNFIPDDTSQWYSEHTGDGSYVPMSRYDGYSLYSKLTVRPIAGLKLSLVYNRIQNERLDYGHSWKYNPKGRPTFYSTNDNYTLLFNHTISRSIFHEFKFLYLTDEDAHHVFENPTDSRYVSDWYGLILGSGFYTGGQDKNHSTTNTKRYDFKYDFTWQVNKNHSLKTGFLYTKHDRYVQNYDIVNKYRGSDLDQLMIPVYNELGEIVKIDYPFFEPEITHDSTAYTEIYQKKPTEFSVYLQDKLEFDQMVINVGLRYDYYDPSTTYPSDPRNPANQWNFYLKDEAGELIRDEAGNPVLNPTRMSDYPDAEVKQQLSPRLGLSYVLGDKAKLHFSYGHFFQAPDAYAMYANHDFRVTSANFATLMGNPNLRPEKSVKYEVGLWQELLTGIGLDVVLYYSDVYDLLSTMVLTTYNDTKYGMYTNKDYGNRRGLEVGVTADFNKIFASLNYTLQYTRGNADNPRQTFDRLGGSMDPVKRLIPMNWDQRNTLNATVSYHSDNYGLTLTGFYNSGTVYTWQPIPESRLARVNLYPNNAWKPSQFKVDLTGYYDLPLTNRFKLRLSLLVYNLFDRLNEESVDATTGRANQAIIRDADLAKHHSDYNTYYDRIMNPANYSAPREIKLRLGVTF